MNKKAEMSLETVGKAILVLAIIVILLVIFTNLLYGGKGQLEDIQTGEDGVVSNAQACIIDPTSPECEAIMGKKTDDSKDESDTDPDFEITPAASQTN